MRAASSAAAFGGPRHVAIAAALTAAACLGYLALLTDGDWNPFGNELCGLVFNDMLARLARGDVTIDPVLVRGEGYIRNGQTLAYWGIFPALLRLPLVPFGLLHDVQVARLSCWLAMCCSAGLLTATYVRVLRLSPPSARSTALFYCLVTGTLFAGAMVASLGSAYVYNEPVFWSVALNLAFNFIVLKRLLADDALAMGDLLTLAILAGLALNCRALEGIALYLAAGWILLLIMLRDGFLKVAAPGIVLAVFLAICGGVNFLRWGSPFTFVDLHFHVQVVGNAIRLAVLDEFGPLNPLRLPFSLAYYFFGTPGIEELQGYWPRLRDLYDGIEGPPSAFPLTASLLLVLGALGVFHLFGRPLFGPSLRRSPRGILLAGVLLAELASIGLLLSAEYLAMRYRLDFLPAFSLAAALGYFAVAHTNALPVLSARLAIGLTFVSIFASQLSLVAYKEALRPSKEEARQAWQDYQAKRLTRLPPVGR